MTEPAGPVVAIVPARNARAVGTTVRSLLATGRVARCVVVDDGSTDDTARRALDAGATVVALPVNWGKGDAVRFAVEADPDAGAYLLVDADLGDTAGATAALLDPVLAGTADVAIAVFPSAAGRGGFGVVKRASADAIRAVCGYRAEEPLSGQRAVRGDVLRSLVPAPRFGLEVAMTVDVVRAGHRIVELPLAVDHDHTGRSLAGFAHRGAQAVDIARGLVGRLGTPALRRTALTLCALGAVVAAGVPAWARERSGPSLAAATAATGDRAVGPLRRPIVLVTVTNTSLSDLDRGVMPNIRSLMTDTGGALTPRLPTGPEDQLSAFASLGAGAPVSLSVPRPGMWSVLRPVTGAAAPRAATTMTPDAAGDGATVRTDRMPADRSDVFGRPGALGDALRAAGVATAYVGARSDRLEGTGALAIADANGHVDHVATGSLPAEPGADADAAVAERSAEVGRLVGEAGVVLVDAGGSQEPWQAGRPMSSADRVGRHERRLAQVAVADALVGRLVADHPGVLVLVAGVSPASQWRLTPLAASGDRVGALWSPSTRRPGLSVLTDLAPTILAAAGLGPADGMVGQRLSVGPEAADLATVQDLHERTIDREGLTATLTVSFIALQAVVYALALLGLSLRRRRRAGPAPRLPGPTGRLLAVTERFALTCAALPVVTFLYRLAPTPWQRPVVAGALIAAASAAIAAVALRFRRHPLSPLVFVAGLTVATMAVDAATSGLLQNVSLFGYTPLTAARYYGMGNLGFAVFGSAAIVLAGAWVASTPVARDGWWAAMCLLAAVTVLQVAPVMGADFGGALVLVPTVLLAACAWGGLRLTPRRLALAAGAAVALIAVLVGLDESLGDGSHVARFAHAGPSGMWEVVHRKLDSNVRVLTTSSWSWSLVIVGLFAAGAVVVLGRRTTWFVGAPAWRTTLLTLVGFGVLGGVVNDSGIAIPAMVAVYVGALLLLLARRTPFTVPAVLAPGPPTVS